MLTSEISYDKMQFVINIFAKQMQKFKKLEVARCHIVEKIMMPRSATRKNSGTKWEKIRTFVLNVYFTNL
jgi:hypothetical protein